VLLPQILAAGGVEKTQAEEHEGDRRDDGLERDRARVSEQVVLVEEADPEIDGLPDPAAEAMTRGAATLGGCGHGPHLPPGARNYPNASASARTAARRAGSLARAYPSRSAG